MGFVSEGITNVRAFVLPVGAWEDGEFICVPQAVLVKWKSSWADKFYQVYFNGVYAGTSDDIEQRQIIVQLPQSFLSSVCIEVFAVDVVDADVDFGSELEGSRGGSGRVRISLFREHSLPIGGKVQIYFDNGTGEIDYNNPLNSEPIDIWQGLQDKFGFGMDVFGLSDFGRDWSAGIGFGKAIFGSMWFGVDADLIDWVGKQLEFGIYNFAAKVIDEEGNESESVETGEVFVLPSPKGTEELEVVSFDKLSNKLVFEVL